MARSIKTDVFSFGLYVALQEAKLAVHAAIRYLENGEVNSGHDTNPFRD
jgi:hypothetical protein